MLMALQFLTIVPVRISGTVTGRDIARSALCFPLVGALQGLALVLAAPLLIKAFPVEIAALFCLLILVLSNGGFHLDGLADTFDALAMKSTGDRERDVTKRLAIMKDSTIGVAGVIAVVIALLLKFEFIKWFLVVDYRLLLIMPCASQWLMVPHMKSAPPARPDGLGRLFADHLTPGIVTGATMLAAAVLAIFWFVHGREAYGADCAAALAAVMVLLFFLGLAWTRLCISKFNGITGDTAGALGELADIAVLVVLYGWLQWLRHSI